MDDPKAAGRKFSPWLAAYYGTTWPGITALLAGRDGYLQRVGPDTKILIERVMEKFQRKRQN